MKIKLTALLSAFLWFAFLWFASLTNAQDYSLTLLPTLGGRTTRAFAINEGGQVTGQSDTSVGPHAFLWSRTGGIRDIATLSDPDSVGYAINASAQVVGTINLCFCQNVAALWSPAAPEMQTLVFPGQADSTASGINDLGEVVGTSQDQSFKPTGFLWTPSEGMQDLGALGCVGCFPVAVNNNRQVIGTILQPGGSSHAFIWTQADGMQDLGTLGGPNSTPRAINSSGQVTGMSDTAGGVQHAFFWNADSGMQDLGTIPGETYSWGIAIDESGRVVGTSWHPGRNNGLPFSWTQEAGMKQLGPFRVPRVSEADGVNMAGQILVSVYHPVGYSTYVMTPIMATTLTASPNPSTVGEPVTFSASIGSTVHSPPADGEIVTFMSGGKVLGTGTLQSGVATFTTSALKGNRPVRALYAGDAYYAPSKSALVTQVVLK
ncbi:MAG TPA: Ig-like domain repeat protein [Terriglobales bacterium]|nr:Ig-like domain repeat protein [Terriglobales bacterium]